MNPLKKTLLFTCLLTACGLTSFAQARYKSYNLNSEGDTINAVLQNGDRQGKWVIKTEEMRGEPGFEEEGLYEKGKKRVSGESIHSAAIS